MQVRIAAAVAALCATAAASAQDFSKVVIGTQKITDNVYMLTGAGGNIGVSAGEDGILIIDDQYAPLSGRIQEALAKLSPKPARFVINTHWHGDHTGGNESFGKGGSIIVAHANVRKRMTETQVSEIFKRDTPPSPKDALPILTFTQEVTLHFNGDDLRVYHYDNAHTDGDALIEFTRAKVLHMGDTYFNGMYPFIDFESGGTIDGMIGNANQVLSRIGEDIKIIPGHGPLASKADLVKYRDMLVTLRKNIGALVEQGKTLEQTIAATPTKELDPVWGGGFFKPADVTTMVYRDLTRAKKKS